MCLFALLGRASIEAPFGATSVVVGGRLVLVVTDQP